MLFETKHVARVDFCRIDPPCQTSGFPLHLHEALECYLVTRGQVRVTVDEAVYLLGEGEGVLVFPYQCHSYEAVGEAENFCCLFSPDFVPAYTKDKGKLLPRDSRFSYPDLRLPSRDTYLAKKAFVYDLLAAFDDGREYFLRAMDGQSTLISRILIYLSDNLTGDCSLTQLSQQIGYEYTYLSKYFKRTTGISLHAYTDTLRIARARDLLLSDPKVPIRLVCEACGYSSQRTFDRTFRRAVGMSPAAYRRDALRPEKGIPVCPESEEPAPKNA